MKITNSDVSCMWLFVRHKVGYLVNKKHCVMVFKKKKIHTLCLSWSEMSVVQLSLAFQSHKAGSFVTEVNLLWNRWAVQHGPPLWSTSEDQNVSTAWPSTNHITAIMKSSFLQGRDKDTSPDFIVKSQYRAMFCFYKGRSVVCCCLMHPMCLLWV